MLNLFVVFFWLGLFYLEFKLIYMRDRKKIVRLQSPIQKRALRGSATEKSAYADKI